MEATLALELRMERESNNGAEFVKCKFRAGFCEDNLARNLTNANFELDASTEMYRSTEKVS